MDFIKLSALVYVFRPLKNMRFNFNYPSIHFLHPLNPSVWSRGEPIPAVIGRGWVHPEQVTSPSQGHTETNNLTRSHSLLTTILYTPINLTCMFLDGGRKLEYPERTCKLHTERPQPGVEPGTLLLWGDGANHHTTVQAQFKLIHHMDCFVNASLIRHLQYISEEISHLV